MADGDCRIDVWLWRARFFKTRTAAAEAVEAGRIRLLRGAESRRVDKAARPVRQGDGLVFVVGGRLTAIRIEASGARRGPPAEARALYTSQDIPEANEPRSADGPPLTSDAPG